MQISRARAVLVPQEEGAGLASPSFEPHEDPHEEDMLTVPEAM